MLVAVNFHYIREIYNYPFKAIHGLVPDEFRNQILKLSEEGVFVSQDQIHDALLHSKILPEKSILITFDDGLKEQFEFAHDILDDLGIPAIYFVNPFNIEEFEISRVHQIHLLRSYIPSGEILLELKKNMIEVNLAPEEAKAALQHYNYDDPNDAVLKFILNFKLDFYEKETVINGLFDFFFSQAERNEFHSSLYMDLEILKRLDSKGFLGSHTYSHQPLGMLDDETLLEEFEKSNKFFIKHLNSSPKAVSYPYGSKESCTPRVFDLAKKFNHSFGFTMERAGNNTLKQKALHLARFDCNDVIGGKFSYFRKGEMFEKMKLSNWEF